MTYQRIESFKGLDLVSDSTNSHPESLRVAENVLVRPQGAIRGPLPYQRLWGLSKALYWITGYAPPYGLGCIATDKVVIILLQTMDAGAVGPGAITTHVTLRLLLAYDCERNEIVGMHFIGNPDGQLPGPDSYPGISQFPGPPPSGGSGGLNNSTGGVIGTEVQLGRGAANGSLGVSSGSVPVIAKLLDTHLTQGYRWYFSRIYNEVWMGNGIDDNRIWSNTRPGLGIGPNNDTGELRLAGSDLYPAAPLVTKQRAPAAAPGVAASVALASQTGGVDLTVAADVVNYKGADGNNIVVQFSTDNVSTGFSSTKSGAGTSTSPLVYTVIFGQYVPIGYTGLQFAQVSESDVANFINQDYKATGVITAHLTTGTPTTFDYWNTAHALTGGQDEKTGLGHEYGLRVSFAVSYYDPGVLGEALAYEGPIGPYSSEVVGDGSSDFVIAVNAAPSPPSRFSQLVVWMRIFTGELIRNWYSDPRGPWKWHKVLIVPNTNARYVLPLTYEVLHETIEEPKARRIPPCTMFEFAGDRLWCSGNQAEPYRLYYTARNSELAKVPEGADTTNFMDTEGGSDEPTRPKVTALQKLENRLQIHTDRSVTMLETSSFRKLVSRSDVGAINPACLAKWNSAQIPYLGTDGIIYELINNQWFRSQSHVPESWPALKQHINLEEIRKRPHRANCYADSTNQLFMLWLPNKNLHPSGTYPKLSLFVLDLQSQSLTGPHESPRLLFTSPVGLGDGRVIGADEAGYLWVIDTTYLFNTNFAPNTAFAPLPANTVFEQWPSYTLLGEAANDYDGWPVYTLPDGTKLKRSVKCVLETQMLNMGQPDVRKGFFNLAWTTARYSRAIVTVILTTEDGHSKTFQCGEMYGKETSKIAFCMSGHALRIRIEAIVAEDKPFVVRDLTLGYELQSNVPLFPF